jgi:hypothetical protein
MLFILFSFSQVVSDCACTLKNLSQVLSLLDMFLASMSLSL